MKKLMSIIISILFALSVTGLCFAQAPAAPKEEKKVEEKAEKKAEKKKVKKAKAKKANNTETTTAVNKKTLNTLSLHR